MALGKVKGIDRNRVEFKVKSFTESFFGKTV